MKGYAEKQVTVLFVLVGIYALLAFGSYMIVPLAQFAVPGQTIPTTPRWQLAPVGALSVIAIYGLLGLAGYWFGRKLELPPTFREGAGWKVWILGPMLLGLAIGLVLIVVDQLLARLGTGQGFPHPAFPLSLFASGTAGIGEEILFRGFVMGLWAFLLRFLLKGASGRTVALWIGNVIAALAFSASHLPATMLLLNLTSPAQIPVTILVELILLNGLLGLVAGQRYMRDGLVAAVGIHFWADLLWHVIFPLTGLGV